MVKCNNPDCPVPVNSYPTGRNLNDVEDEWNKRSDNDKLWKNRHLYDQYRFEVKKMNELKKIPTAQLVEELGSREGVEIKIAEPYAKSKIEIEGPAIVLIVTD